MTELRKGAVNWKGPADLEGPELKIGDPAPRRIHALRDRHEPRDRRRPRRQGPDLVHRAVARHAGVRRRDAPLQRRGREAPRRHGRGRVARSAVCRQALVRRDRQRQHPRPQRLKNPRLRQSLRRLRPRKGPFGTRRLRRRQGRRRQVCRIRRRRGQRAELRGALWPPARACVWSELGRPCAEGYTTTPRAVVRVPFAPSKSWSHQRPSKFGPRKPTPSRAR